MVVGQEGSGVHQTLGAMRKMKATNIMSAWPLVADTSSYGPKWMDKLTSPL